MTAAYLESGNLEDPAVFLPPDLIDEGEVILPSTVNRPSLWHMYSRYTTPIWDKKWLGQDEVVAVLDTGVNPHQDLPAPVAERSFISGESPRDGNFHGCIAPSDVIYTSNCGVQAIETLFDRLDGVAYFLEDGAIVKDVSRYGIHTVSLDVNDGNPRAVKGHITHVHKLKYVGDMYEVSVNGVKLSLTPWHPVYVCQSSTGKKRRIIKKRADELKVGDNICQVPSSDVSVSSTYLTVCVGKEYACNKCGNLSRSAVVKCKGVHKNGVSCGGTNSYEPVRDVVYKLDEDMAFWVGLVLTDGYIQKDHKTIEFTNKNETLLKIFSDLSLKLFGRSPKRYYRKNDASAAVNLRLNHVDAYSFLAQIGLNGGAKSHDVDLPEQICKSPRSVVESFFAGCIEGDGCTSNRTTRLITGSRVFADKCLMLLKSLGVKCSIQKHMSDKSTFGCKSDCFSLGISSWPSMLSRLRVKSHEVVKPKGNFTSAVKSIVKKAYDGFMYDFTVDKYHNYVANGCIVSNTHVAGSVLGRNGIGWAPEAQLINVKVLSNGGSGSSQGIAAGIHFALDNGATIVNMSLGGGSPFQPTQDALRRAEAMGVLVVSSAGNSGQRPPNNTIGWPARFLESGCSGAKQQNGNIASFSSAGREMDIVTPGQHIISTSNTSRTGYRTASGTSMSCPVGCGLWAVIQSARVRVGLPRLRGITEWRAFWAKFTVDRGAPGHDPVWGMGVPDYDKIIEFLATGDLKWL